ncbi:hypothetical protein CMO96_00050 [Candidatus Woesebacteria bacterium]|nr:hypothetical protein [Candidatus Woesebacteria bacterium]
MASTLEKEKSSQAGGEHPVIEQTIEDPSEAQKLEEGRQELEGYLEKVERQTGTGGVSDDATGQTVLSPNNQNVSVTLPLTEDEIKHGLHHKITDAIRWLAEWSVRMAKKASMLGTKVVYRKDE